MPKLHISTHAVLTDDVRLIFSIFNGFENAVDMAEQVEGEHFELKKQKQAYKLGQIKQGIQTGPNQTRQAGLQGKRRCGKNETSNFLCKLCHQMNF